MRNGLEETMPEMIISYRNSLYSHWKHSNSLKQSPDGPWDEQESISLTAGLFWIRGCNYGYEILGFTFFSYTST